MKRLLCAALMAAWSTAALSHDWYGGYRSVTGKLNCCGGSDCAQLPDDAVKAVKGGYVVTYLPPDFPNRGAVKLPLTIPNSEAQPGEDTRHYHMCIVWDGMRCFFTPSPGF